MDINENILIFKALSDLNRQKIIEMLSCGELCACRLLEMFNITQPTLSHHMKVLTGCGLVKSRKDGTWTYYSLNRRKIDQFIGYVRHLTNPKQDCICNRETCGGDKTAGC